MRTKRQEVILMRSKLSTLIGILDDFCNSYGPDDISKDESMLINELYAAHKYGTRPIHGDADNENLSSSR